MRALVAVALLGWCVASVYAFWMEDIAHHGYAPFAGDNYTVFRNVRDYGAKGDGVTDDTKAINDAIADGNRCGQDCNGSTTTPAVVYFPAGTYAIAAPVTPYYLTQLIGDPLQPPTLRATAGFAGSALVDGNPYYSDAGPNWLPANVFYRQVRNLVLDTTAIAAGSAAVGVHWPTAQATSLQNLRFVMPTAAGVAHVGLVIEAGSGGLLADLTFVGGATGAALGNQQFTARGLSFEGCVTGIRQAWSWGWTYARLRFADCQVGIDITAGGPAGQRVGSITVVDSTFAHVAVALRTAYTAAAQQPSTAGSVVLENIAATNVSVVVQSPDGTVLPGVGNGTQTIIAWGQGHAYEGGGAAGTASTTGPTPFQGAIAANGRPAGLLGPRAAASNYYYYARSKPQYETVPASRFHSARAAGAVGDGVADDTAALQRVLDQAAAAVSAAAANSTDTDDDDDNITAVVYLDHGLYRVTTTLTVPPGTRLVGEAYPVLLASGHGNGTDGAASASFFGDAAHPQPLLRVGAFSGQPGTAELSDVVLGTQGPQPGAVLVQWNLAAPAAGPPGGLWDVHTRVGGFAGSVMQVAQCGKTPGAAPAADVLARCTGAFLAVHVTAGAANVYAENVWLWTADHDLDDAAVNAQISVYAGRGWLVESAQGPVWLVGTGGEHHVLYQYQLAGTQNVFLGQVQTETPYWQPLPAAPAPFAADTAYGDPDFAAACAGADSTCAMAWGLRIVDAANVLVYGAGLYSFFNDYEQDCIPSGSCQARIVSLEGAVNHVRFYNLNTIGAASMLDVDGVSVARFADNVNVYPGTIALFTSS